MRRITVVSRYERSAETVKKQLENLLGDLVRVECTSAEQGIRTTIDADLILLSSATMVDFVSKYQKVDTQMLVMRRTITRAAWDTLMAIPPHTRALLVNAQPESTYETITMLYELGANHLELLPYYPGAALPKVPAIAITPNEAGLVPPGVDTVIDIGERMVDGQTVLAILTKLDLFNEKTANQVAMTCLTETIPTNPDVLKSMHSIIEIKHHLELVLGVVAEGIITYDDKGRILACNSFADNIFNTSLWKVRGTLLQDFFSDQLTSLYSAESFRDCSYTINGANYLVDKYPLYMNNNYMGGMIRFTDHGEIERLEQKIREAHRQGHAAKYTVEHIVGISSLLRDTCTLAKKMARGDGAVLIEGESGVGKELFAQAIHNASSRRTGPFVAFNCAAVPDQLIESELFGYEDGAFTGTRKGGKQGLFELAHRGTIFLDEIGDLSRNLQAKLLRVLQEKEVVRVGGNKVKRIDIRVLTATNRDLQRMVREGEFRQDLYYRINALRLRIPPLRDRREDIFPLLDHFFQRYGVKRTLCEETLRILERYPWPGNVRELANCATYLANMSEQACIAPEDLPLDIREYPPFSPAGQSGPPSRPGQAAADEELGAVLAVIREAELTGRRVGRGEIARQLADRGLRLSEQEVRARLRTLNELGLADSGKGRAGTRLTPAGRRKTSESINAMG